MTAPTLALAGIVPIAFHDDANRLATAFGYQPPDGDTFSIRLSSDGTNETHRAFVQSASDGFAGMLSAMKAGTLPPIPWSDYGLSEQSVIDLMAALFIHASSLPELVGSGQWLADHLAEACSAHSPPLSVLQDNNT